MNEKKELRKLVFLLIFLNNIGIFSKLLWPFVEEYLLVLTNSDFELIPILWKYLLKLESANKGFCMFDLGNRFYVWFITEEGNWFQTIRRNNSNTVFWSQPPASLKKKYFVIIDFPGNSWNSWLFVCSQNFVKHKKNFYANLIWNFSKKYTWLAIFEDFTVTKRIFSHSGRFSIAKLCQFSSKS